MIASYVVKLVQINSAIDGINEGLLFIEVLFYFLKKKYVYLPKRNPLWQERVTQKTYLNEYKDAKK